MSEFRRVRAGGAVTAGTLEANRAGQPKVVGRSEMSRRQSGFTLVEIAVVLVIIGLLLGGVLKGQELIASARVRNLADQQSGIQAAYYGFIDRYRAVPGDMPQKDADNAMQATVNSGGDGNGKIDGGGTTIWTEANAAWEQMSKAGFIKGSYEGSDSTPDSDTAPTNVFNGIVVLGRDTAYTDNGGSTPPVRLVLHMGRNVPADIARELDVKIDDGHPYTGTLRNAPPASGTSNYSTLGLSADNCTKADSDGKQIWDIDTNVQDCNPTYLF